MLPGKISKRVVSDRLAWVHRMLREIRALPLESKTVFMQFEMARGGEFPHALPMAVLFRTPAYLDLVRES